jgi:helicase SWR1
MNGFPVSYHICITTTSSSHRFLCLDPLEKAIEQGNVQDHEVQLQVSRLHSVLRPYLLRRIKNDVEQELPKKYDHLVLCRLSKRQRFLYDEFMSRAQTKDDLKSGVYQRIANILMQLRKVCNHPDLFEVRPIVTSFAMDRSAIADFEIKELLWRRKLQEDADLSEYIGLDTLNLRFTATCNDSLHASHEINRLQETSALHGFPSFLQEPAAEDFRTVKGFRKYEEYRKHQSLAERQRHMWHLNRLRCSRTPILGIEATTCLRKLYISPLATDKYSERPALRLVKSYTTRLEELLDVIDKFAFATPAVVARDLPSISLRGVPDELLKECDPSFDAILHKAAVKLQIAFPDLSLLQYDCGKLQNLAELLRERKKGGHRVLIFTQMTRILDILETFLNFHGYLYLRLDGATKIEDRQYITERFNVDTRVFAFIASSRSGGVGIK